MKLPQTKEDLQGMRINKVFELLCEVQAECILVLNEKIQDLYHNQNIYSYQTDALTKEQINFLNVIKDFNK